MVTNEEILKGYYGTDTITNSGKYIKNMMDEARKDEAEKVIRAFEDVPEVIWVDWLKPIAKKLRSGGKKCLKCDCTRPM